MKNLIKRLLDLFRSKKPEAIPPRHDNSVETVEKSSTTLRTEVWQVTSVPKAEPKQEPTFTSLVNKTERDIDRIREIERAVTQQRMKAIRQDPERPRRSESPTSSRSDDTLLMTTYVATYSNDSSSRSSSHSSSDHSSSSHHDSGSSSCDSGSSPGGCD